MCSGSLLIKQNAESQDIITLLKHSTGNEKFHKILVTLYNLGYVRKMTGYNVDDEDSTASWDGSCHHCIQ